MAYPENQVSVRFDRKRMSRKLFGSIILMMAGLFYIFMPLINTHYRFSGYFFIIISLFLAFHSVKRLTTSKPGFLIDPEGIHDYTGAYCIGPVLWCDVTKIRIIKVFWQKMIVIDVNNAQAYINRQKNGFNKITMSLNHIFFGSPFCINTSELNISLNDLFEEIDRNFKNNKEK